MRKAWKRMGISTLVALTVASTGLSVYTYMSTPSRIQEYVNAHKSELKGDKGEKGDQGSMGPMGLTGRNGANGGSGSINCMTYGINNQYTSCY